MKKQIVGNLVKFTFDDNVPALTFDCTKMSGSNRAYAIPFGMCHRLGDMAALSRTTKDGAVINITEQMRHDAIAEGIAYYENADHAEWNLRVARAPEVNPVWKAIAEKRGMTYEAYCAERVAADLAELEALA